MRRPPDSTAHHDQAAQCRADNAQERHLAALSRWSLRAVPGPEQDADWRYVAGSRALL